MLLISNRIVMLSQTGTDILSGIGFTRLASLLVMGGMGTDAAPRLATTDPVPLLRAVAAAQRPALVSLLFPHSPLSIAHRVLLPYTSTDSVVTAAKFAALTSPAEVEVHVVRVDSEPRDLREPAAPTAVAIASPLASVWGGGGSGGGTPTRLGSGTPILGVLSSPSPALTAAAPASTTPSFRASSSASTREVAAVVPLTTRPNTRHFTARGKDMPTTLERVLRAHPGVYRYAILNGEMPAVADSDRASLSARELSSVVVTVPEDTSLRGGEAGVASVSVGVGVSSPGVNVNVNVSPPRSRLNSVDSSQEAHFTRLAELIAVCATLHTSVLVIFPMNMNVKAGRRGRIDSI